MDKQGPISILDVGAGGEGISNFLRYARLAKKYQVTLADSSQDQFKRLRLKEPTKHVLVADGSQLPFFENSFDIVIAVDTVEHVPREKRPRFFQELQRVTRSRLILHFPLQDETGQFVGEESDRVFQQKHLNLFGAEEPNTVEHFEAGHPRYDEIKALLPDVKIWGTQNAELWLELMINAKRPWIAFASGIRFGLSSSDQIKKPPYHACLCISEKKEGGEVLEA